MSETTRPSTLASAEQLFAPIKRRYQKLTLPVSGLQVRIQSLNERELSTYQAMTLAKTGSFKLSKLEDANRRLIVLCLVDDAGNRILNGSHVAKLEEWDSADTAYLSGECSTHVGLRADEIEGLVKNSSKTSVAD